MANTGAPPFIPITWPIGHVTAAITKDDNEKIKKASAKALIGIMEHVTACVASTRSWLMGYALVFYLPEMCGLDTYPAFGPAKVYSMDWMSHIIIRNLIGTWVIAGFWDWFLYFSPLKDKLHKYKMNPNYPSFQQFKTDAFYTTIASLIAGIYEIIFCHCWAAGYFPMQATLSEAPVLNILFACTITHYRIPHFFFLHRAMHPWKTTSIPDFGKIIYRSVHSLHHKSYNPTAFSGTAFHPVESILYYSASFIPVICGLHPVHTIGVLVDMSMGSWLGHDGFQFPGSGNLFHHLHHAHFDCNYGTPHVPLDWIFGTYAGSKEEVNKIWEKKDETKAK